MSKESIKMTPGDDAHLTLLMAPVSLNLVTGQDRQHLLALGRAAFEAGQKCQDCDVPKDGVYQISEPSHSMSQYASKDDMLKAVMAENEQLKAQLAAAQHGVPALYQFQDRDGKWCNFMNEEHYKNTVADGSWPIRALYTHPTPQGMDAHDKGEVQRLRDALDELLEALRAIVDEVSDGRIPYSSDSYLPAHLVEQARAALAHGGEE